MSKSRFTEEERIEALMMQLPGAEARALFMRLQRVMHLRGLVKLPRGRKPGKPKTAPSPATTAIDDDAPF